MAREADVCLWVCVFCLVGVCFAILITAHCQETLKPKDLLITDYLCLRARSPLCAARCDCVPVTLFEVADLWKELSLVRDGLTPLTTSSSKGQTASASDESL